MLRYTRSAVKRVYDVEVSGGDRTETFFVEKCELQWNEESGKEVALKRALNDHTLLLVRLPQPGESDLSCPVVYEAELRGKTKRGLQQFRLNTAVPRLKEEEFSAAWPDHLSQA